MPHGRITRYITILGTVEHWVLTSQIIGQCQLHLEGGVLINPHSRTRDNCKLRLRFEPCVDLSLLEILKIGKSIWPSRISNPYILLCRSILHCTKWPTICWDSWSWRNEKFWNEHIKYFNKWGWSHFVLSWKTTQPYSNIWL